MEKMTVIPRKIHSLWHDGLDAAPDLVKKVVNSWKIYAPECEIEVLDGNDLQRHLNELGLGERSLTIQAASDILRTKLLHENGGYWLDATCLLSEPFLEWIEPLAEKSGFLALTHPGEDRILSSWLLAGAARNDLLQKQLLELMTYWSKDRRIYSGYMFTRRWEVRARYQRRKALLDPIWAVSPNGYAKTAFAPYFFYHYLSAYTIQVHPDASDVWEKMPKVSAVPAHSIGHACKFGGLENVHQSSLCRMIAASPVHKLNWRLEFPASIFSGTQKMKDHP